MDKITLKDIRIYGFHGCLIEEGQIGSEYLVNLAIKANLIKASETDSLEDTVDYVHLNKIIKEEMEVRSNLLEHVGKRIIDRVFVELPLVEHVDVTVSKVNPPIGGDVAEVSVTMVKDR